MFHRKQCRYVAKQKKDFMQFIHSISRVVFLLSSYKMFKLFKNQVIIQVKDIKDYWHILMNALVLGLAF